MSDIRTTKKLAILTDKKIIEKNGKKFVHLEYYYPDNKEKTINEDRPASFVQANPTFKSQLGKYKIGDTVCLLKHENLVNGKSYWNTVEILDKDSAPAAKPVWSGNKKWEGKSTWKDNSAAQKIGGLFHDLTAIVVSRYDSDTSADHLLNEIERLMPRAVAISLAAEKLVGSEIPAATKTTPITADSTEELGAVADADDLDLDLE